MKFAIVALVLAVCLVQSTEAWWGGMYGLGYGWGGLYGLGFGYPFWGKRAATETMPREILKNMPLPTEVMNRTECVYTKESSMLSCKGNSGVVECESSLKWDGPIEAALFGIADCEEVSPMAPHFRILPRKTDNSVWLKDSFLLNTNEERRISLFYSDKLNHMGLKVLDEKCFEKMRSLLDASDRREKVFLKDEVLTATIRGDLMITDKLPELKKEDGTVKRWWGYGGLWGGWGGLYGWGWPYYYGKRSGSPAIESFNELVKRENYVTME